LDIGSIEATHSVYQPKKTNTMVDGDAHPAPKSKPLVEIERSDMEGDDEVDEGTKQRQLMEKTFWTRLAEGSAIASAVLAHVLMGGSRSERRDSRRWPDCYMCIWPCSLPTRKNFKIQSTVSSKVS
jgi:hypothetical protein